MKTEYNNILQSVESDKEMLNNEWNSINWNSVEYNIFKIQKRIFEAEKVGNYRKVNSLCRLLKFFVFLFSYKLCSSRLWLKPHGRFLGEKGGVILLTYPTFTLSYHHINSSFDKFIIMCGEINIPQIIFMLN